jgi:hypothetical protein
MGAFEPEATDISTLRLDVLDPRKMHCYGIKIASQRGWWKRKSEDGEEEVSSGFDYGREHLSFRNLLCQLPKDSLVSMHLHGLFGYAASSNPATLAAYASKYPHLKFIANHCGSYGGRWLCKPATYAWRNRPDLLLDPAFKYIHTLATLNSAAIYANGLHNILLESSIFTLEKARMLQNVQHWCIGSDYPFLKDPLLFTHQQKKFVRVLGNTTIEQMHADAVTWLETPAKKLLHTQAKRWV